MASSFHLCVCKSLGGADAAVRDRPLSCGTGRPASDTAEARLARRCRPDSSDYPALQPTISCLSVSEISPETSAALARDRRRRRRHLPSALPPCPPLCRPPSSPPLRRPTTLSPCYLSHQHHRLHPSTTVQADKRAANSHGLRPFASLPATLASRSRPDRTRPDRTGPDHPVTRANRVGPTGSRPVPGPNGAGADAPDGACWRGGAGWTGLGDR